ncbi:hypothetical protein TARUN_4032 [Trichoderma arundinaceum]|uniref:Uncharacterized protein n=1 Tax=Trichoderma arundinaceum TaxID=490622 RepID=A0A395NQI1_TRIAR|nr:hypothetical protein TARUN_4032 [Trichoderma arundinaceum]
MKASGWSVVSGRLQPRHEYLESLGVVPVERTAVHSALVPAAERQALTVPRAEMAILLAGHGLVRRSNVADRRLCDDHVRGESRRPGSRKLGEISGTALLLLQMQLRRHARMKNAAWDAVVLLHLARGWPGRARRRLGARPGSRWAPGVCSWQSKLQNPQHSARSSGAAEGLRVCQALPGLRLASLLKMKGCCGS